MKKIILILFLFIPLTSLSQLKSGAYNIVKHSCIVNGEDMFKTEKMLGTSFFIVDLQNKCISFTASDYVVAVYDIVETLNTEKSTLYICKDRKTEKNFKIMFSPHASISNAGELMISQSSKWFDFFTILKAE